MEDVSGGIISSGWDFANSTMGKRLIFLVIAVILAFWLFKQYEKKKYNGYTKEGVIKEVASMYALGRIDAHSGEEWSTPLSMAIWYDEHHKPNISDGYIKVYLNKLGVDYVKYPSILKIGAEVNKLAYLKDYV